MAGLKILTKSASLKCAHGGRVDMKASQHWVRVGGDPVLVDDDTVGRPIAACPMATPANPPCSKTVSADSAASFSALVKIDGRGVCLNTATGMTDWSKLAVVPYAVLSPGQDLVTAEAS